MKKNIKFIRVVVIVALFYTSSCTERFKIISYSIKPNTMDVINDGVVAHDMSFINYRDYIFEFIPRTNLNTIVYSGNDALPGTTITVDTFAILVHYFPTKTYTKISNFSPNFKVIEKDKPSSEKQGGVNLSIANTNAEQKFNQPLKTKKIDGLPIQYFEKIDSGFRVTAYLADKTVFNSPYELFFPKNKSKYSFIGYNITHLSTNQSHGMMISNMKPLNDSVRQVCKQIIMHLQNSKS
jgi:hypothetical protein